MKKKTATKRATKKPPPIDDGIPPTLNEHGRKAWLKWCSQAADYDMLENYCIAYQTMISASQSIGTDGIMVEFRSPIGHLTKKKNPACDVLAAAQRTLIACSNKLGLKSEQTKTDAFSEFD
jgi:P27 family predicted phage terminase small subunit